MKSPVVSIIIPCYNAAQYLETCLNSLESQVLQEWEAIVVDDGSKDKTADMGKAYAVNDSRIKFLSKNNEGVSITRNRALKMVQGKYVFFLDADDYLLDNETLQTLVTKMEKNSLEYIRFEHVAVNKDNQLLFPNKNKYLSWKWDKKIIAPAEYLKKIALVRDEFYLCMGIFCTSIIKKYDLSFIPYCRYREDADFIIRYLGYCKRIMYLTTPYYAYRKHETAATVCKRDYSNDIKMLVASLAEYKTTCNDNIYNELICSFEKQLAETPSVLRRLRKIFQKVKREVLYMLYR